MATAWKIKCSYDYIPNVTGQNDRQDRSLTGQVPDQAGHCPLTGRYFQPWPIPVPCATLGHEGLEKAVDVFKGTVP